MIASGQDLDRVVITGVGLTAQRQLAARISREPAWRPQRRRPLRNPLCRPDRRGRLQLRRPPLSTPQGPPPRHQGRQHRHLLRQQAIADAGLDWENVDRSGVGIYVGVTEHGNVETEQEIFLLKGYDYDTQYWSHHHNPRTVANNPAGEISLNLGVTGPHYTLGAACAAGNAGVIQGVQMLRLGDCNLALAGGVSESIHTFGIFASFQSQGALARNADPAKASRPFDMDRNGIVVAEGGCMFVLERLRDAKARGAKIYGEVAGYAMNSDAHDFVLPHPGRQAECIQLALRRAGWRRRTSTSSARTPPAPPAATPRKRRPSDRCLPPAAAPC